MLGIPIASMYSNNILLWQCELSLKRIILKYHFFAYKRKVFDIHGLILFFTGMLSRWDDSQRFLSDHPYLVCEETAKYLILWCFHLEAEQVSCET